jgi:prolyl-tRNA synthetase
MVDPNAKLEEELIVRPTSEAIIWSTYKGWVHLTGFTFVN